MVVRLVFTGKLKALFSKNALQYLLNGHRPHSGTGLQMMAPKSMMDWLYKPGCCLSSNLLASELKKNFPSAVSIGLSIPKTLDNTRNTFPSITARGSLNANEAMAAAVYGPIPFNFFISS